MRSAGMGERQAGIMLKADAWPDVPRRQPRYRKTHYVKHDGYWWAWRGLGRLYAVTGKPWERRDG